MSFDVSPNSILDDSIRDREETPTAKNSPPKNVSQKVARDLL